MTFVLVIASYLIGSIPFGWVILKRLAGVDLRKEGSGATGGTNVFRTLKEQRGTSRALFWAAFVGVCDLLKAFIPTFVSVKRWPNAHWLHFLVAAAASAGHTKSVFLGFTGGKAVSTTVGSFLAITAREPKIWRIFQVSGGVFFGTITGSRGVISLGSVLSAFTAGFYAARLTIQKEISAWYGAGIMVFTIYIVYMHGDNIKRMLRGRERRTKFW